MRNSVKTSAFANKEQYREKILKSAMLKVKAEREKNIMKLRGGHQDFNELARDILNNSMTYNSNSKHLNIPSLTSSSSSSSLVGENINQNMIQNNSLSNGTLSNIDSIGNNEINSSITGIINSNMNCDINNKMKDLKYDQTFRSQSHNNNTGSSSKIENNNNNNNNDNSTNKSNTSDNDNNDSHSNSHNNNSNNMNSTGNIDNQDDDENEDENEWLNLVGSEDHQRLIDEIAEELKREYYADMDDNSLLQYEKFFINPSQNFLGNVLGNSSEHFLRKSSGNSLGNFDSINNSDFDWSQLENEGNDDNFIICPICRSAHMKILDGIGLCNCGGNILLKQPHTGKALSVISFRDLLASVYDRHALTCVCDANVSPLPLDNYETALGRSEKIRNELNGNTSEKLNDNYKDYDMNIENDYNDNNNNINDIGNSKIEFDGYMKNDNDNKYDNDNNKGELQPSNTKRKYSIESNLEFFQSYNINLNAFCSLCSFTEKVL